MCISWSVLILRNKEPVPPSGAAGSADSAGSGGSEQEDLSMDPLAQETRRMQGGVCGPEHVGVSWC